MATAAQLQAKIDQLNKQLEKVRTSERPGVIARIRHAIEVYGLTPADLALDGVVPKQNGPISRSPRVKSRGGKRTYKSYGDGAGNVWGGVGPRPAWLRDALKSGKQLSDFLTR